MVRMTRNPSSPVTAGAPDPSPAPSSAAWRLQDAKARFSELVRRVRSDGPQQVTVHGRVAVVVISADEFQRLKGQATGQVLIDALQASPCRDVDLEPGRAPMRVRDVRF
jgi:prevent-host-death family protein